MAQYQLTMKHFKYILLVLIHLSLVLSYKFRYDGYQVFNIFVKNENDVKIINEFGGDIHEENAYLIIADTPVIGKPYPVVVNPKYLNKLVEQLQKNKIAYHLVGKDLQNEIDAEELANMQAKVLSRGEFGWTQYHTLEEIYDWLDSLVEKYDYVTPIFGGKTFEGREIRGVKLSQKQGNPGIFIEAGIHAREWIAPATATYILNELLTSENKTVKRLGQDFDWYIFPVTNPDGFHYTHIENRLWRKNRSKSDKFCNGVDLNRNWDFHWQEAGTGTISCLDNYGGEAAFSELETKMLSEFIASIGDKLDAYISFHSFSQLLLFPYGHTSVNAPNHDDMQNIGNKAVAALAQRYGTKYKAGNIHDTIYPASGSSIDWAYGKLNVSLSYTYELRPQQWNGIFGFMLPPRKILPTGEETLDSVVAIIEEGEKLGYFRR